MGLGQLTKAGSRRRRSLLALVSVLLLVAAACGGDDGGGSSAGGGGSSTSGSSGGTGDTPEEIDPIDLTVAVFAENSASILWTIGHEEGIFEENGINTELIQMKSGADMAAAVVGGTAQFAVASGPTSMPLMAQGQQLAAVPPVQDLDIILILGADHVPDGFEDLEYPDTVKALEGLTIGVPARGSAVEVYMVKLLEDAGMAEDAVDFLAVGAAATAVPALQHGQVHALFTNSSTTNLARSMGVDFSVVANSLDGTMGDLGDDERGIYSIASHSYLDDNPETFERVCASLQQVVAWMADSANLDRGGEIMAELTGLDAAAARDQFETVSTIWNPVFGEQNWNATVVDTLGEESLPHADWVRECP